VNAGVRAAVVLWAGSRKIGAEVIALEARIKYRVHCHQYTGRRR